MKLSHGPSPNHPRVHAMDSHGLRAGRRLGRRRLLTSKKFTLLRHRRIGNLCVMRKGLIITVLQGVAWWT